MPAARVRRVSIEFDTYTDLTDHDVMTAVYRQLEQLWFGWGTLRIKVNDDEEADHGAGRDSAS